MGVGPSTRMRGLPPVSHLGHQPSGVAVGGLDTIQVTILKKVEAIAETCQQVRTAAMILRLSEKM